MAWTDEALSLSFWYVLVPITKWFQHRNCESGSNTSNTAIKEVGCSWLLSNSFANHLSINMWHENMQNQSCKWFIARCMLYKCTFRPVTQLGGACSRPPQLYCHTWSTIALVHLQILGLSNSGSRRGHTWIDPVLQRQFKNSNSIITKELTFWVSNLLTNPDNSKTRTLWEKCLATVYLVISDLTTYQCARTFLSILVWIGWCVPNWGVY